MKTREHLKKAITRIVQLEEKEAKNTDRINKLELNLTTVISKLEQLGNVQSDEEDHDSLAENWDKAEKDDPQPGGSKPPVITSINTRRTNRGDIDVQEYPGGRSEGPHCQGTDAYLDLTAACW